MAVEVRPFETARASSGFDWLNASHHFSFGHYHDPARMGVGPLRVWNDDEIAPHTGFDPHPHRDMEIITYVRRGAITHQDSLGNEGRTEAGDVQVMSAGTGIRHAEYNREDGRPASSRSGSSRADAGPAAALGPEGASPRATGPAQLVPLASGRPGHDGALPIDPGRGRARRHAGARPERRRYRLGRAGRPTSCGATGRFRSTASRPKARDGVVVATTRPSTDRGAGAVGDPAGRPAGRLA